jgi:hypothetical protein
MSIRIAPALRIEGMTLDGFRGRWDAFRQDAAALAKQIAVNWIVKHAVRIHDDIATVQNPDFRFLDQKGAIFAARDEFQENWRTVYEKGHREPETDVGFEVCVIPKQSRLLIIGYVENTELWATFQRHMGGKDFWWTNAIDCPSEVPYEEWREREGEWADALSPYKWAPAKAGIAFRVFEGVQCPWNFEEIDEFNGVELPSFQKRVDRIARSRAIMRIVSERPKRENNDESIHEFISATMIAEDKIKADPLIVEAEKDEIRSLIDEDIDLPKLAKWSGKTR